MWHKRDTWFCTITELLVPFHLRIITSYVHNRINTWLELRQILSGDLLPGESIRNRNSWSATVDLSRHWWTIWRGSLCLVTRWNDIRDDWYRQCSKRYWTSSISLAFWLHESTIKENDKSFYCTSLEVRLWLIIIQMGYFEGLCLPRS